MPYANVNQELPFTSGSDTSREAAISAESFAANQRTRYFMWLLAKGERGGTDAEAEAELGMRRSSVCARRNELRANGAVVNSGQRRGGCSVWRA